MRPLLENARTHIHKNDPHFVLSSKDFETSSKIAQYNLFEFPGSPGHLYLYFYPNDIEHLDKPTGTFITRNYNEVNKEGFLIHVTLGASSLNEWNSAYSFKEYVHEVYRLLDNRNDIDHLNLIDTDHKILNRKFEVDGEEPRSTRLELHEIKVKDAYGLEVVFPYTSPAIKIEDEVKRVSNILSEVHSRAVKQFSPVAHSSPVEIRKVGGFSTNDYRLFINSIPFNEAEITAYDRKDNPLYIISMDNSRSLYSLGNLRFSDFPERVVAINIVFESEVFPNWEHIVMEPRARIHTPAGHVHFGWDDTPTTFKDDHTIKFRASLDVNSWKGAHSPKDYLDEIDKAFTDNPDTLHYLDEPGGYNFHIEFRVSHPNLRIVDEVIRCRNVLLNGFSKVENKLEAASPHNSIEQTFNFPEEVGFACEQYLVYFVQFLKDLGVNATSELKHKAGQVLFTVTPTNEEEALDKIRIALDVYLHLPASPVGNDMSNEIAIQRLESQVLRFQSDLRLAAAELQAKNATIEAQQLTINVQRALLNGEILLDSMEDVTPKEKEEAKVEFFDGSVALGVYKDKGVELNWAKMWKQLKELFLEKDDR
jgi:hypothetical protein